jgi:hypothetical protein
MESIKEQLDGLCRSIVKLSERMDEQNDILSTKVGEDSIETLKDRIDEVADAVDRKPEVSDELKNLIENNGRDAVVTAFKQCVGSAKLKETAGYTGMIQPDEIEKHFLASIKLKNELGEVANKLIELEGRYKNSAKLISVLKLDVKMAESNAIMNAPVDLKNAAQRDAFRRQSSSYEREKLAAAEGELEEVSSEIRAYKYKYDTIAKALDMVKEELQLLGSVFKFLA